MLPSSSSSTSMTSATCVLCNMCTWNKCTLHVIMCIVQHEQSRQEKLARQTSWTDQISLFDLSVCAFNGIMGMGQKLCDISVHNMSQQAQIPCRCCKAIRILVHVKTKACLKVVIQKHLTLMCHFEQLNGSQYIYSRPEI